MDITFARQTLSTIQVQYTVQDYNANFHWSCFTLKILQSKTHRELWTVRMSLMRRTVSDCLDSLANRRTWYCICYILLHTPSFIAYIIFANVIYKLRKKVQQLSTMHKFSFLVRNCLFRNAYQMIKKINYFWVKELSDLPINKENWVRCTASKLITWLNMTSWHLTK